MSNTVGISRLTQYQTVTIASGTTLSNPIDFKDYAGGIVHMPSAWTAASIGFQVATSKTGTYYPLFDEDGSTLLEIATPTVDEAYAIPAKVFASLWVKLWSQTSESGVNQGADRVLVVSLKG